MSDIKLITFTTLYPNSSQPRHGVFVENRLRHLLMRQSIESIVIAPVPWFPFRYKIFGQYSVYADVPRYEKRHGIEIYHPRFLVVPKIGMLISPFLLALGALNTFRKIKSNGYQYQIIDAHYFYPDGVAACLISKWLSKELVITARGTDINLIPIYKLPRSLILWAGENAKSIITVCEALKDELINIGAKSNKITVLRNGVDLKHFQITAQNEQENSASHKTLLSVGHLIERKGHHIVIEMLKSLPHCKLIIVGGGELENHLKNLTKKLDLVDRVTFVGEVQHKDMPAYFNSADALVLASDREGMANVLLEALACGTPVVAFDAWGAREVIKESVAGRLVKKREPEAFAKEIMHLFDNNSSREDVREYAEQFSWDYTTQGQLDIFKSILNRQEAV